MRQSKTATVSSGFTLIEYLVSLTVGLIVIAVLFGLIQVFIKSDIRINRETEGWQRGYQASQYLVRAIHQAGYAGCIHPPEWTASAVLRGGPDELIVRYADPDNVFLTGWEIPGKILYASSEQIFKQGDVLLANNCRCAEQNTIQTAGSVRTGRQKIILQHLFACDFLPGTALYRVRTDRYFVGTDKMSGEKALILRNSHNRDSVLMSGINGLKVEFPKIGTPTQGVFIRLDIDVGIHQKQKELSFFASTRNLP